MQQLQEIVFSLPAVRIVAKFESSKRINDTVLLNGYLQVKVALRTFHVMITSI